MYIESLEPKVSSTSEWTGVMNRFVKKNWRIIIRFIYIYIYMLLGR